MLGLIAIIVLTVGALWVVRKSDKNFIPASEDPYVLLTAANVGYKNAARAEKRGDFIKSIEIRNNADELVRKAQELI